MSTTTIPCRKRSLELEVLEAPIQSKRRANWFRLESESSAASTADDTESVYSIQDKETDIVRDTSDTDSDSTEYDIDIEYEIGSLSDDDGDMLIFDGNSSGESEDIIYAAAVVADSSLETFITDAEDSDNNSRQGDSASGLTDFWICIQCKSQNDNPQFRFCDKCFQDRKAIFPPRPRRRRRAARSKEKSHSPVKLDALQSCLNGLSSQDSGICSSQSSQEFGSLCLDQIVVPNADEPSTSLTEEQMKNRKRQISESSLSDEYEAKKPRKQAKLSKEDNKEKKENGDEENKKEDEEKSGVVVSGDGDPARTNEQVKGPLPELKEDCIMCNIKPKNSVFLHGRIAHMCCCYGCAMRTWKSLKRCPICQRKVSNVVRVFTT